MEETKIKEWIPKEIANFLKEKGDFRSCWITWLEKQSEKKFDKWEPQIGDTFRKKGTISPTYHLCDEREDGITFGFVENREVGISGGEITIFALKDDYELVERLKPFEEVVEEEFNKNLQTKGEQKSADNIPQDFEKYVEHLLSLSDGEGHGSPAKVKEVSAELFRLAKLEQKSAWSKEDETKINYLIALLQNCTMNNDALRVMNEGIEDWLKFLKDRVQPQNIIVTDEEFAQAKKDAYNDALDKIEYHSGELTFDDGWSAAIWYLKKRDIL